MKSLSKDMINFLRICLSAAMILFSLGCFSKNPSYPISWPQTIGSNEIESQIEGSFLCSGDIIKSDMGLWDMKSITGFLIGGENPPICDYVEISKVQSNEMEIRFMESGAEIMRRNYKKNKDYRVEDNWIVLKPCVSWGGEDVIFARGSVTPHLTIDVKQNLIIRAKNTTAGVVFLVIPIGSSGTDWGRFKRIKSDYNKAIEIDPRDAKTYYNRGVAFVNKRQYDQAISDFTKALEINPRLAEAYFSRANVYDEKGQPDQAISDYNKALEINPRYIEAYNNRGVTYRKKGQYDQAISDLTKALEISPRDGKLFFHRGWIYYLKKEYDKSWEDVKKAQNLGYEAHPEWVQELRKALGIQN